MNMCMSVTFYCVFTVVLWLFYGCFMVVLCLFYACLMVVEYLFFSCALCVAGGLASVTWFKHPSLLQNDLYMQCMEAPRRMRWLSDTDGVEASRRMCSFSAEGGVERSTRLRRNSLGTRASTWNRWQRQKQCPHGVLHYIRSAFV